MQWQLDLWIGGIPQPQGSKDIHHSGQRSWVTESNAKTLGPWRDKITTMTRAYCQGRALVGPAQLETLFVLPRPKYHVGKRGIMSSAPPYPDVKPDLDKLIRAICDAVAKGGALINDSQIVHHHSFKVYNDEQREGVRIVLQQFPARYVIPAPLNLPLLEFA